MIKKEETQYSIEIIEHDRFSGDFSQYVYFNVDEEERIRFDGSNYWMTKWRTKEDLIKILEDIIFELQNNFIGKEETDSMAKKEKEVKKSTKKSGGKKKGC
jgi:hypothetical protein